MARILITGGSGFIGTNLTEFCLRQGDEVVNLDVAPPRNPRLAAHRIPVDILDDWALTKAVHSFHPEFIFHMAARTDLEGKSTDDYMANVNGVRNLIEAARGTSGLQRVVFASSMYVCKLGHIPQSDNEYCPATAYGHSKAVGETIVREHARDDFAWVIVRPTSIWGPWFGIPYKGFFQVVRKGFYLHPRGREIQRSYGFVFNTVRQLLTLISPDVSPDRIHSKVYYLADSPPVDVKQWADLIATAFGNRKTTEVPLSLLRGIAFGGDILKKLGLRNPPLTSFRLKNMMTSAVFDLDPIESLCGSPPYFLEEGTRITAEWMCCPDATAIPVVSKSDSASALSNL